jgi:hypothetical protein
MSSLLILLLDMFLFMGVHFVASCSYSFLLDLPVLLDMFWFMVAPILVLLDLPVVYLVASCSYSCSSCSS